MTASAPLDTIVAALERLNLRFRRVGDQVDAQCPAHHDETPSLSITHDAGAGKVLINCHVGCAPDDVVAALNLTWSDLFDKRDRPDRQRSMIVAEYDYTDEHGTVVFQKVRMHPKDFRVRRPDGRGGWSWKIGNAPRVLYRLPEVRAAIAANRPVLVVEGEKDADRAANQLGMAATCNYEGAAADGHRPKWRHEYTEALRDAHVLVVADNDAPGMAHARAVAASLRGVAAKVGLFRSAVEEPKADLSDHLDAGHGIADLLPLDDASASAPEGVVDVHVHPDTARPEGVSAAPLTVIAPGSATRMPTLPEEFWQAREVHTHVRQAAYSRLAGGDLVLHTVLAKIAAMRSHELFFDSGRGKSSLNHFAAIVGASGMGKTSGTAAVDDVLLSAPVYLQADPDPTGVPDLFLDGLPLGSGEGLAEAYIGTKEVQVDTNRNGDAIMKKVRAVVRHNVFVIVDEGETFTRLGERTGATVSTTLRSAWVGATIGQANGRDDTTRIVRAHEYALGMVVGFQPSTALPLLSDTSTGTAQRFAWVAAADPTLPLDAVAHPGPLTVPLSTAASGSPYRGMMTFPEWIKAELRREHIAKVRGELVVIEPDSQGPLMRCKLAALLALLNGRYDVNEEDWQLGEVLWRTSCSVRDHVTEYAAVEKARQAEIVADARVQLAERTAAAVDGVTAKLDRLAVNLAERVVEAGGMRRGDARRGMAARDRHLYESAVERAQSKGLLRTTDGGGLLPPPRVVAA